MRARRRRHPPAHDGYLKLFQLDAPLLRGFDAIAVDEAQDLNPSTYDVVRRQPGALVLVGDSAQQIFGFRGSADALAIHPADEQVNILYVALTRARAAIRLSEAFGEWLRHRRLLPT